MPKIRKAIIPVAGLGTRFLPATKAQPKEMLTLVDKPVIQYIVEEAVAAGIKDIIFVTSSTKRVIEDHFDRNFELEYRLQELNKKKELVQVLSITELANFSYVRQKTPLGDGHAVLQAKTWVGDEPCAVLFGDDLVISKKPCIAQLIKVFEKYNDPVMAVMHVPKPALRRYGIVRATKIEDRTHQVHDLIEKPEPEKAPSDMAIIGRYIITPKIFEALTIARPSHYKEIRLIDAFREVVKSHPLYAYEFEGIRHDCGNKLGYLEASVSLGLSHKEIGRDFNKFIKGIVC